jgi:hypothetical protein
MPDQQRAVAAAHLLRVNPGDPATRPTQPRADQIRCGGGANPSGVRTPGVTRTLPLLLLLQIRQQLRIALVLLTALGVR